MIVSDVLLQHVELLAQEMDDRIFVFEDGFEGGDLDELGLMLFEDMMCDGLCLLETCDA